VLVAAKVHIEADVVGLRGFPKRGVEVDFPDVAVVVRIPRFVLHIRGGGQLP
jgi:hypothetical protein